MAKVGWVKLHRKVVEWEFFKKPEMVQLLVYLMCKADEEGAIVTTTAKICEDLNLTRQVVRDCLKRMEITNTLTIKSTNKNSHLTLCKFGDYNGGKNNLNQQVNQQINQQEKEKVSPTPPIKENIQEYISSISTSACEEENFIEILKRDRVWGETVEMRYRLQPNSLCRWVEEFSLDIQCRDTIHRNIQDAKRHFCDWLRIQLRYGQKSNTTSKAEYIAAEKERIMREVLAASKH